MVMTAGLNNYTDKHYTPVSVASLIVNHFNPGGIVLEPCRGGGAFYDALPDGSSWCEIEDGKDFFDWTRKVDWIITNPPYSILTNWMQHSFSIADNVVLFIPISKLFSSVPRMNMVRSYGGIREMYCFGSGRSVGLDLGFPMAAIHFQKDWLGDMRMLWANED